MTDGKVTAAAIYLPMRDKLYCAAKNVGGATLNGWKLTASDRVDLTGAEVLAAKPTFEPWRWKDAQVPKLKRNFRSSLAYRLALVGEGRFDAMLTLRPTWEWDVAAGALIVTEAGGRVTDQTGGPLVFNREDRVCGGALSQAAQYSRTSWQGFNRSHKKRGGTVLAHRSPPFCRILAVRDTVSANILFSSPLDKGGQITANK